MLCDTSNVDLVISAAEQTGELFQFTDASEKELQACALTVRGDVPETLQETLTTAATAELSRAKLDNIVPHLAASVQEVSGDIQAIEFAIEATAGMAVSKELSASLLGDTDYARDTAKLAAQQVISQAATAILAQANARSATVLTLLK